jgi:hypothetical protein
LLISEFSIWKGLIISSLYPSAIRPNISGEPSLENIVRLLQEEEGLEEGQPSRAALVFRHALQWGIERGDDDLVAWLAGLTGRWVSLEAGTANLRLRC